MSEQLQTILTTLAGLDAPALDVLEDEVKLVFRLQEAMKKAQGGENNEARES